MTNLLQKHTAEIQVLLANLAALGITIADIQSVLTVISLLLAIAFTIWKWRQEIKKYKRHEKHNQGN